MDPDFTRTTLQIKVQYDIRLYFCCCGAGNIENLLKDHFTVQTDENGHEFVAKTYDEMTKNHKTGEKEIISGIMPASGDKKMCPVHSFKKYLEHLHL